MPPDPRSSDIHAQVVFWRTQRSVSWVLAMAIGPTVTYIAANLIEMGGRWFFLNRYPAAPVSMNWSAFAGNIAAGILVFGMVCALVWLILRATPHLARGRYAAAWQSVVKLTGIGAFIVSCAYYVLAPAALIAIRFIEPPPEDESLARAAAALTLHAGTICIALWLVRWRGRGIRCARCAYAMSSRFKSAGLCPECGNAWKRVHRSRYGSRHAPWLPLIGVAVCVIAIGVGIWIDR